MSAADVVRVVRNLCDAGMSAREIARRTGTGRATLADLLSGRRERVTRAVAQRIVAAHRQMLAVDDDERG